MTDRPLSYLTGAASDSASLLQSMAWVFSAVMILVVVVIIVLIAVAIARSRDRAAASDELAIGPERGGLSLIWWGLALSLPVLLALAAWTFSAARALADPPKRPGMEVTLTGHQWWWEIRYEDVAGRTLTTANELVVPTGVPIHLNLGSGDVIHDFWVPKLGPKMDMVPGRTNRTWIEAREPGTYRGQCAEYCGLEHARMGFVVRALEPAKFGEWFDSELQPASQTGGEARDLFVSRCGACHTMRGSSAGGIMGPDLTHFSTRETIGAGAMANTPANLDKWLLDPQAIKPGVEMPRVPLTSVERHRIVAMLESTT